MMNTYIELLEQVIAEMKVALSGGNAEMMESDYCQLGGTPFL